MREESVGGRSIYVGTVVEIAALLRKHADVGDGGGNYFGAADMRRAADEIQNRARPEYSVPAVVYRVGDTDVDRPEACTRGTP